MIKTYKTPVFVKKWYPDLTWEKDSKDSIHLTFDDGPHPFITPWILSEFEKKGAKATFFCVGENLAKFKETARQTIIAGHQLANHTHTHLKGWQTMDDEYLENIAKCDSMLDEVGVKSTLFRPPYGRIKKSQIKKLKDRQIVMWSHFSRDFDKSLNIQKSIRLLKNAKPGSILLFHDNEKSFSNLKQLLPVLLEHYHSKGLKFEVLK